MTLVVAIVITLLLWASSFSAIKAALVDFTPLNLATFRFGVASAVLLFLALFKKVRRPDTADIPTLILAGLLGITGYHAALNYGQTTVSAGAASFVVNTVPLFTTLLAAAFLGEKPPSKTIIGLMVSFCGVLLIAFSESKDFTLNRGAVLILVAALFQSGYIVLQKPLLKKYSVFEVVCYTIWAGTAGFALFAPATIREIGHASTKTALYVIYLGIFPGVVAGLTWSAMVARLPASQAVSFLYVVPALSIIVAWIWLSELPTVGSIIGGLIILAGVAIVNHAKLRSQFAPASK
jgi:drug/metabolite transporter (DMT)-like permease